ncbi:MAG: hypothetical protein IPK82_30680 [Polyangiaceae bacterium]|nr:hypothetical protein [Polyangiaceae bacterium]
MALDRAKEMSVPERMKELQQLMAAFTIRPIDPADATTSHLYFPFHKEPGNPRGNDPITELRGTMVLAPTITTCQLFSGFQGTGKSTELRRLSAELQMRGFQVLTIEGARYINLYEPLEVTDLLVSIAAGVAEAVWAKLGVNPLRETLLTRVAHFLERVEILGIDVGIGAGVNILGVDGKVDLAKFRLGLKENPSFKAQIQDRLRNKLTTVLDAFREYMGQVRAMLQGDTELSPVLIIDDLEKVQGHGERQELVARQVEAIFSNFHFALKIEGYHTVWSSPPYLRFLNNNIAGAYDNYTVLPMVRVWHWEGAGAQKKRVPDRAGLDAIRRSLELRGDIFSLFESPDLVDELITASSGHIRDVFRLMQDVLRGVVKHDDPRTQLGKAAIQLIVSDYIGTCQMAVYKDDYPLLREIAATQRVQSSNEGQVSRIAKLMDTQLVMIYRNGNEWFDVSTPVQLLLSEGPPDSAAL